MKIRDVMTPDIDVVAPDDTLTTAAQLMADLDFETLPVSDNNRLTGVITGRDIAARVVADGCDPKEVTVGRTMTRDALYCFENEPVIVLKTSPSTPSRKRWLIGGSGGCRW
jgi:CBS domain-containing protein